MSAIDPRALRRRHHGKRAETRARGQFGKSLALRSYRTSSDVQIIVIADDNSGSIWMSRRGLLKFRADIDRHLAALDTLTAHRRNSK